MELCNGDKCLRNDTLIVLCYALFCICFGLIVATLVVALDKRRNKRAKQGVEVAEVETYLYIHRYTHADTHTQNSPYDFFPVGESRLYWYLK